MILLTRYPDSMREKTLLMIKEKIIKEKIKWSIYFGLFSLLKYRNKTDRLKIYQDDSIQINTKSYNSPINCLVSCKSRLDSLSVFFLVFYLVSSLGWSYVIFIWFFNWRPIKEGIIDYCSRFLYLIYFS